MHIPARLRTALFWLACAIVSLLSLLPTQELPPVSLQLWDKAQHFAGFVGLAVLGAWAYARSPGRMALGLLGLGVLIEVAQWASGWRQGDWQDALADSLGVAAGLGLAWLAQQIQIRR